MEHLAEKALLALVHPRTSIHHHEVAWPEVVEKAVGAGLGPLLWKRLEASTRSQMPPVLRRRLESSYSAQAGVVFFRLRQVREVLRKFSEHGVPVLVLKGLGVAQEAYRDPVVRLSTDLDILVPPEELSRASKLLGELGYLRIPGPEDYHLKFRKPGHDIPIELHWSLHPETEPYRIPVVDLWGRSRVILVGDGKLELPCLGLEDLLIYQCLHLVKHRFHGDLRACCDIAYTLAGQENWDWSELFSRARSWRARSQFSLVLAVVDRLFSGLIPEHQRALSIPSELVAAAASRVLIREPRYEQIHHRQRRLPPPWQVSKQYPDVPVIQGYLAYYGCYAAKLWKQFIFYLFEPSYRVWRRNQAGLDRWLRRPPRLET